ncbi:MAG: transposase family protein [Alteromonadales bacterium]|nr:transposase family protein [Alteromonadales bacterium]
MITEAYKAKSDANIDYELADIIFLVISGALCDANGLMAIENSQHWVLDVTFQEDECQIYAKDGARN